VHRSLASLFVVQCTGCIGTRFFVHTGHHTATCVNASGLVFASLTRVVTEPLRPLGVPHNNHTKAGWPVTARACTSWLLRSHTQSKDANLTCPSWSLGNARLTERVAERGHKTGKLHTATLLWGGKAA